MPLAEREPHIHIEDGRDGQVSIHVRHYGRVPDLTREFSPEVLRQAVNKWRRSTREDRILKAAWGLSWTGYRLVQTHLIRERALAIEHKMQLKAERKAGRASWSRQRAEEQQLDEREPSRTESAESQRQRGSNRAPERAPAPTKDEAERAKDQSWLDALLGHVEQPQWAPHQARPETLTQQANRELREAKAKAPKMSRAERKAMQRAHAEREDSLRDRVEFIPKPEKRPSLTEKARQEAGVARAEPKGRGERAKDRER